MNANATIRYWSPEQVGLYFGKNVPEVSLYRLFDVL